MADDKKKLTEKEKIERAIEIRSELAELELTDEQLNKIGGGINGHGLVCPNMQKDINFF